MKASIGDVVMGLEIFKRRDPGGVVQSWAKGLYAGFGQYPKMVGILVTTKLRSIGWEWDADEDVEAWRKEL